MTDSPPTNLADLLRGTAAHTPDAVAFIDSTSGHETTWATLDAVVDSLAAGLHRHGLAVGDRVALLLGNRIEFVATYLATLRAGMVSVPLNVAIDPRELAGLLEQAGARLVVADEVTEAAATEAVRALDTECIVVGDRAYDALARAGLRADAQTVVLPATDPESLAVLLFTSGAGGPPRGAMLSHRALLADIAQLGAIDPAPMAADDVVLLVLPLFHVYALNAVLGLAIAAGACCLLVPRFSTSGTLALVREHGVTHIPAAPSVFVAWSRVADLDHELAGVRALVSGAAPLTPAVAASLAELAGQPVWEGYGLTEAGPVVSSTLVGHRPKPGCVGAPLPGVEVRFVDEDGEDADEDDPGEIWVRGPNLFSGYWPDAAGGPDPDGWWATGDIGYADEEGDLHLVDRRRDLIVVSGFNVYPFEIENVIAAHPDVAEAAAVGIPHERTGEAVKAFVVPVPGRTPSTESIAALCEKKLARFKCPTWIEIVPSLPHTATGTISRAQLREESR